MFNLDIIRLSVQCDSRFDRIVQELDSLIKNDRKIVYCRSLRVSDELIRVIGDRGVIASCCTSEIWLRMNTV